MAHEKDTRKKGGVGKILLVLVVLLALAVGGALLFAHNEISGNGRPGTEVTVSIPQGSGVSVIAQKLKDAGVIRSAYLFRWYVGQKGAASKLQYGDFTLQKSACSYDAIIAVLSTYAKAETVRVTIPEGTTAIAIAQKMEAAGLCSAEDFLKEANEGDFSEYTFWQYVPDDADAPDRFMKCEGYLFPETYEFLKDDTVHNYVATFYAQFDAQITDEMYAELKKQDMTLPQLITLASFVQEEAGNSQDSNVAQVFRNRLAADSPYPRLQSNTSSYIQSDSDNNYLWNWVAPYYGGWDNIPENIVAAYDTYSCKGLPAGPISNPGIAAIKAALAFFHYTGLLAGVEITIYKNVPVRAGMAGGSADAAGVLVGLNVLYGAKLSMSELCALGAKIGADVPFALMGGTCRVQGVGDVMKALPPCPDCWFTVVMPDYGVSTPEAFAAYDKVGSSTHPDCEAQEKAIRAGDLAGVCAAAGNALEECSGARDNEAIKTALKENGAVTALMTGSGAAVFGIFESEEAARNAAEAVRAQWPQVYVARPDRGGARVISPKWML